MWNAHRSNKKNELIEVNRYGHLLGMYVADALRSTVCNMFIKKGSKAFEYPENPYELDFRTQEEREEDELNAFFKRQEEMRKKWRKYHNKESQGN